MTAWTTKQDAFVSDNCNRGAEWLADAMAREFGVERTPGAVMRHCSRMGLSLRRYEVCPHCGCAYTSLRATGLCPACAAREARDRTEARYFEALDNQAAAEAEARRYATENAKYRKRISRLKKTMSA